MKCTHCGTPLPPGALFCGECGRSVASGPAAPHRPADARASSAARREARVLTPARWVEDPVTGEALGSDADEIDVEVAGGSTRCEQCDSVMAHDDIFCGECGFVSRSITRAFQVPDYIGETRQVDVRSVADAVPELETPAEAEPEPGPGPEPEAAPEPEPEPEAAPEPEPEMPPPAAPIRRFLPDGFEDDRDDVEATRIVNRLTGNRFVLQFSTGESVTVHGTGLIGRNPQPEPGEFFDHLVRVLDSGKSVSKTHLEFGQDQGAFWVKDRFSGNGTVIREPDISARRAEPDRRYRVVRGTRIDIGEQFFVIS